MLHLGLIHAKLYYTWLCAARCLELVAYCNQVDGAQYLIASMRMNNHMHSAFKWFDSSVRRILDGEHVWGHSSEIEVFDHSHVTLPALMHVTWQCLPCEKIPSKAFTTVNA